MSYESMFAEILAGCLLATVAVAIRIRLEKSRNPGLRTKGSRQTPRADLFRTK